MTPPAPPRMSDSGGAPRFGEASPYRSVVLLSGGLDSAVIAAMESRRADETCALWIDYGQLAARRELKAARRIARFLDIRLDEAIVRIPWSTSLGNSTSALASPRGAYVPARNLMLITLAALRLGSDGGRICIGATSEDSFPDTRLEYFAQVAPLLGGDQLAAPVEISAPLATMTKQEVLRLAVGLGIPLEATWSCYRAGRRPCGECLSCTHLGAAIESEKRALLLERRGRGGSERMGETKDDLRALSREMKRRNQHEKDIARAWEKSGVGRADPAVWPAPPADVPVIRDFVRMVRRRHWTKIFLGVGPDGVLRVARYRRGSWPHPSVKAVLVRTYGGGKDAPTTYFWMLADGRYAGARPSDFDDRESMLAELARFLV